MKQFLRLAFYRRFDLAPHPEFVKVHPGGGAVGVQLKRYDILPQLITRLKAAAKISAGAADFGREQHILGPQRGA